MLSNAPPDAFATRTILSIDPAASEAYRQSAGEKATLPRLALGTLIIVICWALTSLLAIVGGVFLVSRWQGADTGMPNMATFTATPAGVLTVLASFCGIWIGAWIAMRFVHRQSLSALFGDSRRITVDASAMESNNQLEVVLVLDNTGSMAGARISALRTATKSLLDYLEAVKSPTRKIRASLVPFVTAVNVNGDGFDPAWIDMDGKSSTNGLNFPAIDGKRPHHMALFKQLGLKGGWNNTGWKGCVEARPGTYNISDTQPDPSRPDTLFVPYFAPDDPAAATKPSASYGNSATGYNNSYLDDTIDNSKLNRNILGIDLGGLLSGTLSALLTADLKTIAKYVASTNQIITETGSAITVGPNRACPTPVVPLTDDFDKLRLAASQMTEWNGSGTNVSEGLAWGMRVLSPEPPYTDGAPWKTAGVTKIVMLLTDGENVVYGASNQPTKSDYTSYGYLAGGRFGSDNQTAAARNVDGWTKTVCSQLKNQGARIYTMVLQADTAANRSLYSACASDPSDYYAVSDPAKLPNVFQQIANKFSRLQLTN